MKILENPYSHVEENLLFTKDGRVWAYYELPKMALSDREDEKIEAYKHQLALMFQTLGNYENFHLQQLPRNLNLREKFDALEKDFAVQTKKIGQRYNERALDVLTEELGELTEYMFVVAVEIEEKEELLDSTFSETLKSAMSEVSSDVLRTMNKRKKKELGELRGYQRAEEELYSKLSSVKASRIQSTFIEQIHEKAFYRGQEKVLSQEVKSPEVVIDPSKQAGLLQMISEDEQSYQSFVVLYNTPEVMNGLELFKICQDFSFPFEFHIKGKTVKRRDIKKKIFYTSNLYKQTDREMYENEDEDHDIIQGKEDLNDLRNKINNDHVPFFEWLGSFVVYGKTKKEANQRARDIRNHLGSIGVECVKPLEDQLFLFYKFLQGQPLDAKEKYWIQSTTHEELAELGLGMTQQLGTEIGYYFGRITSGENDSLQEAIENSRFLVLFQFLIAHEGVKKALTDSLHLSITGDIGKGKSFLVKMIFFYSAFLEGQSLMTDPKAECKYWFLKARNNPDIQREYPEFVELIDMIRFITLNPDDEANTGVLDPLNFLSGTQANEIVLSILSSVVKTANTYQENELREIVLRVGNQKENGETVGMLTIVEQLEQHNDKEMQEIGRNIRLKLEKSSLNLVFSDGTTKGINIDEKLTLLEIEGLSLPEVGTIYEDMTESERNSVTVMIALAKFCEYFGKRDKNIRTTTIFDEAWLLTTSRQGKNLVKSLRRVGRSYKNQLVLCTQSVNDVDRVEDNDVGNFGAQFYFDARKERKEILESLEITPTEENLKELARLKKGQCLFRDIYDRKDQLSVDCLFPEWVEAFKTVEKGHSARAEEGSLL